MSSIVKTRIFSFFATLIIVPIITFGVILFARGYRPDFGTNKLEPTGILAATSHPEGAQVLVNGELKTATNNSLNLPLGEYDVQIKKVGFHTWTKKLKIEKEAVTRASSFLFANVPTLKAATTLGAGSPLLSPSLDKVVYLSPNAKKQDLMLLELSESPLGLLNREPRTLLNLANAKYRLTWSPDSRQILIQSSSSAQLVDINSGKVSEASISLPTILSDWQAKRQDSYQRQFSSLPENLQSFLASNSAQLTWSVNDKKILYTATASATMPEHLSNLLPGSNTQPQSRNLVPNHTYTYDIEEDRNFDIGTLSENWSWFPTGNHVYRINKNNVQIKEYDNGNEITLFAGNLSDNFAVPYPSGKQLLVLTNPNPITTLLPNLYIVNLK